MLNSNFNNTLFDADSVARGKAMQLTEEELQAVSRRKSFGGPDDNRHIDKGFGREWSHLSESEKKEVNSYFSKFGLM